MALVVAQQQQQQQANEAVSGLVQRSEERVEACANDRPKRRLFSNDNDKNDESCLTPLSKRPRTGSRVNDDDDNDDDKSLVATATTTTPCIALADVVPCLQVV